MTELLALGAGLLAVGIMLRRPAAAVDASDAGDAGDAGFSVQTLEPLWWRSDTADRMGIDNTPDAAAIEQLLRLKDAVDATFPGGYRVTNAYRTQQLNDALRAAGYAAAPHSYHLQGRAADIDVAGMTPYQAARVAEDAGRFVEVIPYADGHLHVAV